MVANPKKFQLMFLGLTRHRRLCLNIEGNKISATDCVKLLGVEIDNKLKFDKHVKTLCSKANMKINALSRLNTYFQRAGIINLQCGTPIEYQLLPFDLVSL